MGVLLKIRDFILINEPPHMLLEVLVNILGRYLKRRRINFGKCTIYRNAKKKGAGIS